MMALAQKLGFQQEACIRRARIIKGCYYDSVAYGILREEWRERYPVGFAAQLAVIS
jgi:RimJ/RimL family protein N-acetyltransferase